MFRLVVLTLAVCALAGAKTTYFSDPNSPLPPSMMQTMLFYGRNFLNMDHFKPITEEDTFDNFLPNYRAGPVVAGNPVVDGARTVHSTRRNLALQRHLDVNTSPIVPQVTSGNQPQNNYYSGPFQSGNSYYSDYPVYYY